MRIAYINHGRFPTEKAHGFQIAQVCDAMTELGHDVTLLNPVFRNPVTASAREHYGLRHPVHTQPLRHFDAFRSLVIPGFLGFLVSMISYAKAVRAYLRSNRFDVLYLRSPLLLQAALRAGMPVIMELHALPRFMRARFVRRCNRCARIVCLTTPMCDELVGWGVHPAIVIVEADGVDLRRFENLPSLDKLRMTWQLPSDRPVIGYVGSLATRETLEKGMRELIDAYAKLKIDPSASSGEKLKIFLWVVGGPQKWIDIYKVQASSIGLSTDQIHFEGRIAAADVPSAIAACDICVYPAPKTDHPYFLRDTSPLKLFEYLAAGRPVICADIPPVRDVVDEKSVKFFAPGDSQDLAAAMKDVLDHPEEAARRAGEGKRIVQEHSWEKRMGRILKGISDTMVS